MKKFSGKKEGKETIFEPLLIGTLKNTRELGELSGRKILIEREMLWGDSPFNYAYEGYNKRRKIDFRDCDEWLDTTIFYGHIDGLGYFVGADEIEGELREATREEYKIW